MVTAAAVSANANVAAAAVAAAILLSRESLRKLMKIVERAARTKSVLRMFVTTSPVVRCARADLGSVAVSRQPRGADEIRTEAKRFTQVRAGEAGKRF